uniref:BTB domain-containing protein n=1 Tax=Panagrolaimus superbus TaxID=310955 RepID=A0A914YT13_9BILA
MLLKTPLLKTCIISFSDKTTINFGENLEFSLTPQLSGSTYIFHVQDIKGDFEITKIRSQGGNCDIPYDNINKTFVTGGSYSSSNFEFHILTNIDFKKVGYVNISHQLQISATRMKLLKLYECYVECFALPEHEYMKFNYYIKKIRDNFIEIVIENPLEIEIQGKTCDFKYEAADSADINLTVSFVFDPDVLKNSHQDLGIPDSTAQSLSSLEGNEEEEEHLKKCKKPTMYEIMSDTKYSDIFLLSSDGKKIPSYRCILSKYSEIFAKIFEESKENKVIIEGFNAKVISAALDFCYGKNTSILGMESKLFDFANKYCIHSLKEACCSFFENKVNPKNVCEIIQIAFSNNFKGLKYKCKKILIDKKDEVDAGKVKDLPKDILFEVFCI